MSKQKITPHFWFDKEAKEAAKFYVSLFANSKITNVTTLHDTPSGDADIVSFVLSEQSFMAISAGPYFKLNPSISFFVVFDNEKDIKTVWNKLIKGGKALMPYNTYPWAHKYGWLKDKYGVSWQIVPTAMTEMMASKDKEKIARVTQAFIKMKKFDINELKKAYEGK